MRIFLPILSAICSISGTQLEKSFSESKKFVFIRDLSEWVIRTVAEGVETNEHLTLLRQIGADDAQGYLISRPIPADQVPTFTATRLEPPSVS